MSIIYTWAITAIETTQMENDLPDVVKKIHWRYHATDGVKTADLYGCINVDLPNSDNFIPFINLTKEDVVGWLVDNLNRLSLIMPECSIENMQVELQGKLQSNQLTPYTRPSLSWI